MHGGYNINHIADHVNTSPLYSQCLINQIQLFTMLYMHVSIPTADGFVATSQHMCMLDVNTMNFSCISNSDQLCALFKNTLTSNMYRVGGFSLLLFHMHIQMAALQSSSNASSHLENRCCEASDTQDICRTTAVYFHAIFEALPYPLMKMFTSNLISHVFSKAEAASIEEICWTPPLPFCLGSHTDDIINHFLHQVKNHDAKHVTKYIQASCSVYTLG